MTTRRRSFVASCGAVIIPQGAGGGLSFRLAERPVKYDERAGCGALATTTSAFLLGLGLLRDHPGAHLRDVPQDRARDQRDRHHRSEEHTSELQSLTNLV